jgi:hypothetical protein
VLSLVAGSSTEPPILHNNGINNYPTYSNHQDAPTISALIVKLEQLKAEAPETYHNDRYKSYVNGVLRRALIDHLDAKFGVAICRTTHL